MGSDAIALGLYGSIQIVVGRIWFRRIDRQCSGFLLWSVWVAAATSLVMCCVFTPINTISVGLILGASLSHAVETSVRGSVTDYICLRRWLAFNFADLALAAGVLGLTYDLITKVGQHLAWV